MKVGVETNEMKVGVSLISQQESERIKHRDILVFAGGQYS